MENNLNDNFEQIKFKNKILTEKLILSKNKADDLSKIKKLNLWGHRLTDINILRRMPQLIIVSLSANCISSLEPLSHCNLLQELYLRRNQIEDINEIVHLKDLDHLHTLWIGDNPCCNKAPAEVLEKLKVYNNEIYRAIVIRHLPQVQFLDDIEISTKEREMAEIMFLPILNAPSFKDDLDLESQDDTNGDISSISEFSKVSEIMEDSFQPVCTKEYNSSKYLGSDSSPETSSIDSDTKLEHVTADIVKEDDSTKVEVLDLLTSNQSSFCTKDEYSKLETVVLSQDFNKSIPSSKVSDNTDPITSAIMHLIPLLDSKCLKVIKDEIDSRLTTVQVDE